MTRREFNIRTSAEPYIIWGVISMMMYADGWNNKAIAEVEAKRVCSDIIDQINLVWC